MDNRTSTILPSGDNRHVSRNLPGHHTINSRHYGGSSSVELCFLLYVASTPRVNGLVHFHQNPLTGVVYEGFPTIYFCWCTLRSKRAHAGESVQRRTVWHATNATHHTHHNYTQVSTVLRRTPPLCIIHCFFSPGDFLGSVCLSAKISSVEFSMFTSQFTHV